jgi:hypothetical protein
METNNIPQNHKPEEAIKLGPNEIIEKYPCPKCGGILVTNYGPGIEITCCVDCDYSDTDYSDCMEDDL